MSPAAPAATFQSARRPVAAGSLLPLLALLVVSCGGGGGGGGGGGSGSVFISSSTDALAASVTYDDDAPTRSLTVSATSFPESGLFIGFDYSSSAVQNVDFVQTSETSVRVDITLRSPLDLDVGMAVEDVVIHVCLDAYCGREARGSPMTVRVSYTVSDPVVASIDTASLAVKASIFDAAAPSRTAIITLTNPGARPPFITSSSTDDLVGSVGTTVLSASAMQLEVNFIVARGMSTGVHDTDVTIRVCHDAACRREITGSPFIIAATYTVTNEPIQEPGLPPLPYLSRTALSHDVVDAEWTRAFDALVMVSTQPVNALYFWSAETGMETEIPLTMPPTSVSVSPDGAHAAVGHDARITYVDLEMIGQTGAPAPVLLDVSADVFDLVLDGYGYVHALPAADQWVAVHSVYIAGNVERLSLGGFLYEGAHGRLHPSGNFLYTDNNSVSPSEITKYDIRTGRAVAPYDPPYYGNRDTCGDLWMKQDGTTIYTKCGNTFRSSTVPSEDMVYSGQLQLSAAPFGFQILSLSESDQSREIALIEADTGECRPHFAQAFCYTHLGLYDSDSLNRTALYALPPITVDDTRYTQFGLFVFHSADGLHRYMISRLHGDEWSYVPSQYYLTILQ